MIDRGFAIDGIHTFILWRSGASIGAFAGGDKGDFF